MKDFYIGFFLAVAYFVFGKLSSYFSAIDSIINVGIFPSEGIALAFAIIFGREVVWGIFAGQTLYALSNGIAILPSSLIGITNTTEALLAIYFVKHWKIDINLKDLNSVSKFFFLIIFILQPWSAVFGNLILSFFDITEFEKFWPNTLSWYFGNIVSQLVITPMLFLIYNEFRKKQFDIVKFFVTVLMFASGIYFFIIVVHIDNPFLLLSITIISIFAVSSRFGMVYGSVAINVISITVFWLTRIGYVTFTLYDKL